MRGTRDRSGEPGTSKLPDELIHLAVGHDAAPAGFSISLVLPIFTDASLPSRIIVVSFGCEIPSATHAAAGLSK